MGRKLQKSSVTNIVQVHRIPNNQSAESIFNDSKDGEYTPNARYNRHVSLGNPLEIFWLFFNRRSILAIIGNGDAMTPRRGERKTTRLTSSLRQVRYAATEIAPAKSARARGAYLRVSFKNTRETAQAINGWKLQRAVKFLENVKEKKEAVPLRRYAGSVGRTGQGTMPLARWSCSRVGTP